MQVLDVWFPVLASKPGSSNVREGRNLACWKRGSRAFPASQACTSLVGSSTWYILTFGEAHLVELTSHQCGCGGRARRLPRARSEEHLQGHCGRSPAHGQWSARANAEMELGVPGFPHMVAELGSSASLRLAAPPPSARLRASLSLPCRAAPRLPRLHALAPSGLRPQPCPIRHKPSPPSHHRLLIAVIRPSMRRGELASNPNPVRSLFSSAHVLRFFTHVLGFLHRFFDWWRTCHFLRDANQLLLLESTIGGGGFPMSHQSFYLYSFFFSIFIDWWRVRYSLI